MYDYNSGVFADGFLYVKASGAGTSLYRIDVATNQATLITLNTSININDLSYNSALQTFYAYDTSTSRMVTFKISESAAAVTLLPVVNTGIGAIGAQFRDAAGNIYGIETATGTLYQ